MIVTFASISSWNKNDHVFNKKYFFLYISFFLDLDFKHTPSFSIFTSTLKVIKLKFIDVDSTLLTTFTSF